MENLGAMAYSRYTGFREITDRDVLELHCIYIYTIFTLYSDTLTPYHTCPRVLRNPFYYLLMCLNIAVGMANILWHLI